MTPIEKAARALAGPDEGVFDHPATYIVEGEAEEARDYYLAQARAVLQAIRQPDKQMAEAGIEAAERCKDSDWSSGGDGESYHSYEYYRSDAPKQIWQAMIDQALSE